MKSKFSALALAALLGTAFAGSVAAADAPAKNLIWFVVDGLSVEQLTSAGQNTKALLDGGNFALVSTTPTGGGVSDLAASASAFAVGKKTSRGMLSISPEGQLLGYDSIVTRVIPEKQTRAAGLISTGRVTDASVSAFYAHSRDAQATDFIASQAAVSGYDVVLGGGRSSFATKAQGGIREDDDDILTGIGEAFTFTKDAAALRAVTDPKAKVFGLFADGTLADEPKRPANEPSLADMTGTALTLLSDTPAGFALLINEARLDVMRNPKGDFTADLAALDAAIGAALKFAAATPDTLVVLSSPIGTKATVQRGGTLDYISEYNYSNLPVPFVAGGSSSTASWFRGYLDNTKVSGLLTDAIGAVK